MSGYSKTRVDRAGRFLAEQLRAAVDEPTRIGERREQLEEAAEVIDWWRAEHVRPLSVVAANLFRHVSEEGDPIVAQRLKRVPTIAGKLLREERMRLSQMEDIGGVRAVLPSQAAAYRVARKLKRNWTVTRFRDYVVDPKPDGYRALHLVNRNRGRLIEIQLRTPGQDRWANLVEKVAQVFPEIKAAAGPTELRDWFLVSSELRAAEDGSIDKLTAPRLRQIAEVLERADTFMQRLIDES
jgi:ppGpp synthetase/RelA/SpoT-type nucleotidyltranferase